jgi:hypothetical protein
MPWLHETRYSSSDGRDHDSANEAPRCEIGDEQVRRHNADQNPHSCSRGHGRPGRFVTGNSREAVAGGLGVLGSAGWCRYQRVGCWWCRGAARLGRRDARGRRVGGRRRARRVGWLCAGQGEEQAITATAASAPSAASPLSSAVWSLGARRGSLHGRTSCSSWYSAGCGTRVGSGVFALADRTFVESRDSSFLWNRPPVVVRAMGGSGCRCC